MRLKKYELNTYLSLYDMSHIRIFKDGDLMGYILRAIVLLGLCAIVFMTLNSLTSIFSSNGKKTASVDNLEQKLAYAKLVTSAAIEVKCGIPPSEKLLSSQEAMNAIQSVFNEEIHKAEIVNYLKNITKDISCNG